MEEISTDLITIDNVTFYYGGFTLTDEIIKKLESFAIAAKDDTYSVCIENGNLVIW